MQGGLSCRRGLREEREKEMGKQSKLRTRQGALWHHPWSTVGLLSTSVDLKERVQEQLGSEGELETEEELGGETGRGSIEEDREGNAD